MANIVVWGIKDFAELAHFYLTDDSEHTVVAFTLDKEYCEVNSFKGLPVVPFEELEKDFPASEVKCFIPMSPAKMNRLRAEKYQEAKDKGYELISYISSRATYYGTPVGDNCFIFENNVIQPFTTIGNNVTLWSGNHIGHHSTIEDHCFIASHVVVSGHVHIKAYSFLGVNATIRDGVTIERDTLVGAHAFINSNTNAEAVYPGTKAQVGKLTSHQVYG